jgi:hypothetical protein
MRGLRSPYLWGGTSLQQRGKFTSDGRFDRLHYDEQLGIIPLIVTLGKMDKAWIIPTASPDAHPSAPVTAPVPEGLHNAEYVQQALNAILKLSPPLVIDNSFGKQTRAAVRQFQSHHGLTPDGICGPLTTAAIENALAAQQKS